MVKRLALLFIVVALLLGFGGSVVVSGSDGLFGETASDNTHHQAAQPEDPFEDLDSPVGLLASYYNAINRQEYQRAYAYWESPPNSFNDFVNGFADTSSVQLIVQPPTRYGAAAGSSYVDIPTVLIAQHTDGTLVMYAGCFVTRTSNLQPPDIPQEDVWHLYSADISQVPDDSNIPALLSEGCSI